MVSSGPTSTLVSSRRPKAMDTCKLYGHILSRSMIEEIDAKAVEDPDPEPSPHRLCPWSVLKSVSGIECHSSTATVTDEPNDPKLLLSPANMSSADKNRGDSPFVSNEDQGKVVTTLLESEGAEVSLKIDAISTRV
jgi:hypothetical protein